MIAKHWHTLSHAVIVINAGEVQLQNQRTGIIIMSNKKEITERDTDFKSRSEAFQYIEYMFTKAKESNERLEILAAKTYAQHTRRCLRHLKNAISKFRDLSIREEKEL